MRTIYEIICAIIFVLLNVTLVSIVYYYNRHPINKYGDKKLTPEELSKVIAREIGSNPEFYTYEKKANGKYRVYALNPTDNVTYDEKEFDYPVNFDGVPAKPLNELNFKIEHTDNGFKVPGIKQSFECPTNYYWNKNLNKCIEKQICNNYDDSVQPLYDRYYSEIDNPSITLVTPLTGKISHPRLYIKCSFLQQKPIIEACTKENEKFDINASGNNSIKPCKIYNVCEDYPDGTRHAYRINNNFSEALKITEYYICQNSKSIKQKCQNGYEFNEQYGHNNDICKPLNDCRSNIDYYFTINPNSYSYCLSNKRQEIYCGENGIIKLSDNSYQCKSDTTYVYYQDPQEDEFNGFFYRSKYYKGLQKSKLELILFDEWFHEKFPNKNFEYSSLPKTLINNNIDKIFKFDAGGKRKYYENNKDMQSPTKFYYLTDEIDKWKLFKNNGKELVDLINSINVSSKIFHLSPSNTMPEVPCTLDVNEYIININIVNNNPDNYYKVKLLPNDYGLNNPKQYWIIYKGNIYKYLSSEKKDGNYSETIKLNNSSKDYHSFIGAIINEPKLITDTKGIIGKAFREIEGIYYALCLKHDNKFTVNKLNKINNIIVHHKNLATLLDEHDNVVSVDSEKIQLNLNIDLDSLKIKNILPSDFPINEFSWDKLYVGKYYYDKNNKQLIVWHNHLFVFKFNNFVINQLDKREGLNIDDKGQFKYTNYPTNIIDVTYNNIPLKYKNKKYLTALATTFDYYNHNYDKPVVHWLSYIPVDPKSFEKTQAMIDDDFKLTELSVLKYFTISYPVLKKSTIIETIVNILQLQPFTLTFE